MRYARSASALVVLMICAFSTTGLHGQEQINPSSLNSGGFLLAKSDTFPEIAPLPPIPPQSTMQETRNPWTALGLSILVTGGGQFYNGHHRKGALQLGGSLVGAGLILSGFLDTTEDILLATTDVVLTGTTEIKETRGDARIVTGLMLVAGLKAWSLIDAPIAANRINREARRTSLQVIPLVSSDFAGAHLTLQF